MNNNVTIDSNITPTDVKIYVENGIPYLDYTGTCYMSDGCKCKIHLPKVGLNFTQVIQAEDSEYLDLYGYKPSYKQHKQHKILLDFSVLVTDGMFYTYEILERDVSKKQLEKELGYKLNIKEEK